MESSIQALGSIGKCIIEQERPDFGSCEKERHTLSMPQKKLRVSLCSQALDTKVYELADWKTKDCATLLVGLTGRDRLHWRKHSGSRMTFTLTGQLTSVHTPSVLAPMAFLVDALVRI